METESPEQIAPATATATATKPTSAQVIAKFNELRAKYYNTEGYMVSTIPGSIAQDFIDSNPSSIWNQTYNRHVSNKVPILCATVVVDVFGHEFKVRFDRPYKPEHRSEFETYFGFGGHCGGYTDKRVIACFLCCPPDDNELNVAELLTASAAPEKTNNDIDEVYVKSVLALLVLGGYVKYWDAYYEFSSWFESFNAFPGADVRAKDVILPYIFEHMAPICNKCGRIQSQCRLESTGEKNMTSCDDYYKNHAEPDIMRI